MDETRCKAYCTFSDTTTPAGPVAAVFALERDHAFIRADIKNRCHSFDVPDLMDLYLLHSDSADKANGTGSVPVAPIVPEDQKINANCEWIVWCTRKLLSR